MKQTKSSRAKKFYQYLKVLIDTERNKPSGKYFRLRPMKSVSMPIGANDLQDGEMWNCTCSVRMSWPAMEACPDVGEMSPDKMPRVVLLPGAMPRGNGRNS